ncbi:hypothetical protein pb186bvf_006348 [Paramecium bursaria]
MEKRILYKNIRHECEFCRDYPLIRYDYLQIEQEQKTTYIILHCVDWVSQYFMEQEAHHRKFQIISEFNTGQKNLFKADSSEPDQIIFTNKDSHFEQIQNQPKKQDKNNNSCNEIEQNQEKKLSEADQNLVQKQEQQKQEIEFCIRPCANQVQQIKIIEKKNQQALQQHRTYVIKNIESQSLGLFYKSSLTKNVKYFNGFKEFLECLTSFTIYKHFFKYGRTPTLHELNNLYLPYQSLQLIRDYVLKGYPYIYNLDKQNPQTYFEVKNDLLSVGNVYKFEGGYSIKIKYIGNLRDYCKKDTLYIGIALEQVIRSHIIYEPQLDYIQEILLNKMESKILDLLLLPIVIIELHRSKDIDQNYSYLLFGYKDRIYYLGNRQQNEIYIDSDSISNYQCSFEFLNGVWQIFDGFKNKYNERRPSVFGTWKLLYDEVEIKNSGQFKIKDNIFRLQIT